MWIRVSAIGPLVGVLALMSAPATAPSSAATNPGGVDLGGVFGTARASATDLDSETMRLNIEVEADPTAVIVAHLIEPGGGQDTIPLVSRSSGVFGITTDVRKFDYVVVFELLGELSAQSQPVRLTQLGVDPVVLGAVPGSPGSDDDSSTARLWGWAGLGLGAAALAALAYWALPDRTRAEASRAKRGWTRKRWKKEAHSSPDGAQNSIGDDSDGAASQTEPV